MMRSCPACKKEIDNNATRCPFCTSLIQTGIGKKTVSSALYGLFAGAVGGAIVGALFTDYWILSSIFFALLSSWLCYTFGLNRGS
jgi:hypothetical protein